MTKLYKAMAPHLKYEIQEINGNPMALGATRGFDSGFVAFSDRLKEIQRL